MFEKQTLHSLNKSDPKAIVYFDAFGNVIRLTETDFVSKKEFRKWKNWMNMKCHSEENREHKYRNRIISINFDDSALAEFAIPDQTTLMIEAEERNAREAMKSWLAIGFFTCLTDIQQARLWLYAIEEMNIYQIGELEGVAPQAVWMSLQKARKNILNFLQKGG